MPTAIVSNTAPVTATANGFWMRCRGHLERDAGGEPVLFAGIITNLGKKNKVDHLTGVFNKFEFEHEVRRLLDAQPPRRCVRAVVRHRRP